MEARSQFAELAVAYNVIPLVRERLADFETPISMAAKLRALGKMFLFESVEGGEKWGRYSILGFDIGKEFVIDNGRAALRVNGVETNLPGNPIDALQTYLRGFKPQQREDLPRFFGGPVGYFSFETVRFFERCGEVRANTTGFPEAYFMIADHLAVFDNVSHTIKLVCCVHPQEFDSLDEAYEHGQQALDRMEEVLFAPGPSAAAEPAPQGTPTPMASNMSPEQYQGMVTTAKEYIRAGDIFQVVLAQHFRQETPADHLDVYRALRYVNPSPYMYFLDLGDGRAIAGSSPEVMVRVTEDLAEVRPIAGTRPRGETPEEDQRLADELLADPKERAEHVMLVDLGRNDLGRIAEIGSVQVDNFMVIEHYSHVMHIVSNVSARVRPDCDAIDVFKATFPAGTLSGAPKVRAMEIIHDLEPCGRGPYGGAIGCIAYGGRIMDMAITIRTVLLNGPTATVTAGAGIVFDSVPETEHFETVHKSQGMRKALDLAADGLRLQDPNEPDRTQ